MQIKTVTVIGVTGAMGANIAAIFAAFGDAKVYCIGRDIEKVKNTIPRMVSSVKADSIKPKLIAKDFSELEKCVAKSDLVFESLVEDIHIKKEVAIRVGNAMKSTAVSCTGTSGLSINEIAESYPPQNRPRFFGVHMFNPPYNMSLCEFIVSKYSDSALAEKLKQYLSDKLLRTVVSVKDTPAFLGNRIGFQFINEALLYAEKYKDNGGIDYIDAILGSFTGRTMPPLMTSDFVGLDVHKAIVDNIYNNTSDYAHDSFVLPYFAEKLISEKKLGRKSGCGLYKRVKNESGIKKTMVYDISTDMYREETSYAFPFVNSMKNHLANGEYEKAIDVLVSNRSLEAEICLEFLLKYIIYSLFTANEVGDSFKFADDVMATGFNWCPPLALAMAISSVSDIKTLIHERLPDICKKIDVDTLLDKMPQTEYDYRPFFKSGR